MFLEIVLEVEDLKACIGKKEIVKGVSFSLEAGKIVALVGSNGSGKSTLARVIMGDPAMECSGKILLDGTDISRFSPEERSKLGIFLSFQNPPEIEGINTGYFFSLIGASNSQESIGLKSELFLKDLNVGFSGGEKKKLELLQLISRSPKIAILDEIDSGLDVDSLKKVWGILRDLRAKGTSILVITHHNRIFSEVHPDKVLVLSGGKIVRSDGLELLFEIEEKGFGAWDNE